jgi:REP element-mobilizing transposase RayT
MAVADICSIEMGKRRLRRPVQQELVFRTWGGARPGAGRKPKGRSAGVSHRRRPALAARFPVHVTVRMLPHVWSLRSRRSFRVIGMAVLAAADRFGMRVVEFSVQGNHLHLVVEGADRGALSRGMQGLGIRLARGLNKLMARSGKVLADRYHSHILRTPNEVRNAVRYVRDNHVKHGISRADAVEADPYSSAGCGQLAWWLRERRPPLVLPAPRTWLLAPRPRCIDRATITRENQETRVDSRLDGINLLRSQH